MIRMLKWAILPAVLVGGLLLASPKQAEAGGFSFSFGRSYPSYYGSYGYRSYNPSYYGSYYRSPYVGYQSYYRSYTPYYSGRSHYSHGYSGHGHHGHHHHGHHHH